jgi:hypothetical protein
MTKLVKTILSILALAILVGGVWYWQQDTDLETDVLKWKTHSDPVYNFEIKYPPQWEVQLGEKGEMGIIYDPSKLDSLTETGTKVGFYALNWRERARKRNIQAGTFEEYVRESGKRAESFYRTIVVMSKLKTADNRVAIKNKNSNPSSPVTISILVSENDMYLFNFTSEDDGYNDDIANKMISTLTIDR